MTMGLSIHLSTPPCPSCRHQRQLRSTSPSYRVNKCNSACRTGTHVTGRRHSKIQCTKPTKLYRPKDLARGKIAWRHPHDKRQEHCPSPVRKHRNNHPIPASPATPMVVSSSTLLQRISTFNMEARAMPVRRQLCRIRTSTTRAYHSACKQCLLPLSHPPYRHLVPRHRLPIRSKAVESTPLKMAVAHTFKRCPTVLGRISTLRLHLAQPVPVHKAAQPPNILNFLPMFNSNSG